jgi:hypothetical protein
MSENQSKEVTLKTQPKWKSKYFWLAMASLVAFILGNWGLYDKIGLTQESLQIGLDLVFAALTALGIWNDASDAQNW